LDEEVARHKVLYKFPIITAIMIRRLFKVLPSVYNLLNTSSIS